MAGCLPYFLRDAVIFYRAVLMSCAIRAGVM